MLGPEFLDLGLADRLADNAPVKENRFTVNIDRASKRQLESGAQFAEEKSQLLNSYDTAGGSVIIETLNKQSNF